MSEDKLQPHNQDAEEGTIGSLLIAGELIRSVKVNASDFYYEPNQLIFKAMLDLKENGTAINQITVAQKLKEQGKLELVGGVSHLSQLISMCPTHLDCDEYAGIVHRLSTSRQLIVAGEEITRMGYEANGDVNSALTEADNKILKLRSEAGSNSIITPEARARAMYDRYTELYSIDGGIAVQTGLTDLDSTLGGGFFPGELTVLAAATSMGKSALAQSISNTISQKVNVLFFIGEMTDADMSDRDIAGFLRLRTDAIRFGGYSKDLFFDISDKAIPYINSLNVYYVPSKLSFRFHTANIYQAAYEMLNRHGLGLVVIDSLGLLEDNEGNNRNEILGNAMRNIKHMAMDLSVPVLLLHHLSRDLTKRPDKRPELYDLYESGHIEKIANNVIFMYRESYYYRTIEQWKSAFPGRDYPENITELIIAKHRQGDIGRTAVFWNGKQQVYRNLTDREQEGLL